MIYTIKVTMTYLTSVELEDDGEDHTEYAELIATERAHREGDLECEIIEVTNAT